MKGAIVLTAKSFKIKPISVTAQLWYWVSLPLSTDTLRLEATFFGSHFERNANLYVVHICLWAEFGSRTLNTFLCHQGYFSSFHALTPTPASTCEPGRTIFLRKRYTNMFVKLTFRRFRSCSQTHFQHN